LIEALCERWARKDSEFRGGKANIKFVVTREGEVRDVEVLYSSFISRGGKEFLADVLTQITALDFPRSELGSDYVSNYTILIAGEGIPTIVNEGTLPRLPNYEAPNDVKKTAQLKSYFGSVRRAEMPVYIFVRKAPVDFRGENYRNTENDVLLYTLSFYLRDSGNSEEAARVLYKLTQEYANSPFVAEANFRIGEYFFSQYEFDKAVKYYSLVSENSDLYTAALYKKGWALYEQGDAGPNLAFYENAVDAFEELLDYGETGSFLYPEALAFSALAVYWYAETVYGGGTTLDNALNFFGAKYRGPNERPYSPAVLHELADYYYFGLYLPEPASLLYEKLESWYPEYYSDNAVGETVLKVRADLRSK
jgi:tetratricopeptide (TPR) repeat protein